MPKAQITARFKADPEWAANDYADFKKAQREDVKKYYPGSKILSQQTITDGIPDRIVLGELRAKGQVAIRTEFEITEDQAAELRKRLK